MGDDAKTIPALFFERVDILGERVALRRKKHGIWERTSWREYGQRVTEVAAALIANGLAHGDRVAILGDNRPEWLYCHLAAMAIGCVTCGIYATSSPDQIVYELQHSESEILFVENEEQIDKVLPILPRVDLIKVVVWDSRGLWGFSHDDVVFFDGFTESGKQYIRENPACVSERLDNLLPAHTAMMIYTSGTTGRPKAAMITHQNILSVTASYTGIESFDQTDELFSYLPLAHIYENVISLFVAIWCGATVNFVENSETLPLNLREVSPTVFASVPRIWEKFASNIDLKMEDSTLLKKLMYRLAIGTGVRYVRSKKNGSAKSLWPLLYWPFYWLVLYHIRRQLGLERVRVAGCAAAPAAPELFEFYNALGIPLREGYGQTESAGLIASTRSGRVRSGYVGEPLPDCEVRIAADGEILVKGENVFTGYYKDPELTAETIKEGWLHTGDIGVLEDGYLKILDRKKDIIITAGGKNITPSYIENKLKFSPYIQDAVVFGDGRKYLVGLILIDEDNVSKYAQDHRIPFTTFAVLTRRPEIKALIKEEIEKVNKTLARVETIKKFELLPRRFYEEDGDVTPTKKVKRRFLEKRYAQQIEDLY